MTTLGKKLFYAYIEKINLPVSNVTVTTSIHIKVEIVKISFGKGTEFQILKPEVINLTGAYYPNLTNLFAIIFLLLTIPQKLFIG